MSDDRVFPQLINSVEQPYKDEGLTKRELFAAMVLQGFAVAPNFNTVASVNLAIVAADHLIAKLAEGK